MPGPTAIQDPLPIPARTRRTETPKKSQTQTPKAPRPVLRHYESFLLPALILFMLGMALAYAVPGLPFARPAIGLACLGLLLGLVIYATPQVARDRWKIRLSLWTACLIIGALYYQQFHFQPGEDDIRVFAPLDHAEVDGTVEAISGTNRVIVKVRTVNGQPADGKLSAYLPGDETLSPDTGLEAGTRVLLTGSLRAPFHSAIPGTFDQEKYLKTQQITALLKRTERLVAFETSNEPGYVLQRITDRFKDRIAQTFSSALPSPQAEILGGIVLGDRAIPLDRDTRQAFIQTGLVHLLAASGMNVGIIAAATLRILSRLRWNYRAKLLAAMATVAFYSLLTGLPPSIQRASTMLEIALFLKLLNRSLSPALLLCLAGSLLLLAYPDHIGSIGFQFSMLTTFGLITMVPPWQEKLGYYITRGLAGVILVPLVAQMWVWPLSVFYFNQFPIHALPLNLLALLLVPPLTLIGFSAATISLFIPVVGGWLSWLAVPFLNGLLALVQWGDSMTWAKWTLPSPSPLLLFLLYAQLVVILLLTVRARKMPLFRKALLGLVPLLLMLGVLCYQKASAREETQIALLPLSFRHEGYLIKPALQNRYLAILPARLSYYESRAVADFLKRRNITRLEALLLLPDSEHSEPVATLRQLSKWLWFGALVMPAEMAQTLPVLPKNTKLFPADGATLSLGRVQIEARFPQMRVMSDQRCLLAISARYQADSPCAIQAVQESDGSQRLFSEHTLNSAQYHELRLKKSQARLYTAE
ncbi:MAG TPA: ComEC/Rec2 family competence protein [Oculatellaceae cyanobacterium]